MNRKTILLTCALLLALGLSASAALRVEQEDTRIYLRNGNDRILIRDSFSYEDPSGIADPVRLAHGRRLEIINEHWQSKLLIYQNEKLASTISIRKFANPWLDNDKYWTNHEQANEMRYMHRGGGGLSLFIGNIIPQGDSALAILSWRANGPSVQPIIAQHLIRIHTTPAPSVELLASLPTIDDDLGFYPIYDTPRLIRYGRKLLLYNTAELRELTPGGKTRQLFASLPPNYLPIGLLGSRYLVLGNITGDNLKERLITFDLQKKSRAAIPGDWSKYYYPANVSVPAAGNTILIHTEHTTYLVKIPGYQRKTIPATDWQRIWKGTAITTSAYTITLYDPATGKRLKTLDLYSRPEILTHRLFRAIEQGDSATFHRLPAEHPWLARRTSIHFLDRTPLQAAATYGRKDYLNELLAMGADPNIRDANGNKPLHAAVGWADAATIETLIAKGNDVNDRNNEGKTPLFYAMQASNVEAAETLIAKGADLYATTNTGERIAYAAIRLGATNKLIGILTKANYDPNTRNKDGKTLIFAAVLWMNREFVQALIDAGADVNARDADGNTPLHFRRQTTKDIVDLLIQHGATE